MPKLTIDGVTVSAPEGATILDAARSLNVDVPTLCWYPTLPTVGNCRICLVSVEGNPKLVAACATQAAEGMVVTTESVAPETFVTTVSVALETEDTTELPAPTTRSFLLANHPFVRAGTFAL